MENLTKQLQQLQNDKEMLQQQINVRAIRSYIATLLRNYRIMCSYYVCTWYS